MRVIEKEMIDFLDKKLEGNNLALLAISTKNPRNLLIEAARVCYGIKETTGRNDGPMVELIQDTIGIATGESWCMSFVQTCLAYVEKKTGVFSPIHASEHCLTVWALSPKSQRVKNLPLPGAIAIWQHGKTSNGHTGFVLGADDKIFTTIEGNTTGGIGPDGEVVRDGGGVYFNNRSRKGTGSMKVVGFLKPF